MKLNNQIVNLLLLSTAAYAGCKKGGISSQSYAKSNSKDSPSFRIDGMTMPPPSDDYVIDITDPSTDALIRPKLLNALYAADDAVNMNPTSTGPFALQPLDYDYDALEPYIDEKTLRIHQQKLHKAYIDNLNSALARHPEFYGATLDQLLLFRDQLPSDIQTQVTNNAGGNYNHALMWKVIGPPNKSRPTGALADAIMTQFGSFENLRQNLKAASESVFGSGYAWLVLNPYGRLLILTISNQGTPIPLRTIPLLPIDVWEHAYYLKHQNNRGNYIDDYFNVINWDHVGKRYEAALKALTAE